MRLLINRLLNVRKLNVRTTASCSTKSAIENTSMLFSNDITRNVDKIQLSIDDSRRKFGAIGLASKINPAILWPTESELKDLRDFERQFQPSLQDLLTDLQRSQGAQRKVQLEREEKVVRAMAKMPDLIAQYHAKRTRRAGEVSKIDEKRQALLDEAREYFGYDVSPRDPRFLELVERKQEEEKRLKKKMRKEKRVERTVLSLTGGASTSAPKKTDDEKNE